MKRIAIVGMCLALMTAAYAAEGAAAGIGEEAAAAIALGQVKNGRIVTTEFRRSAGGLRYEFTIVNDSERVRIDLDGADGTLLKLERHRMPAGAPAAVGGGMAGPAPAAGGAAASDTPVSYEQAREIALARTGGGDVVQIEKDYKRSGRVIYDIEVHGVDAEYELEIDANTGAIVEFKREWYDDDDDYRRRGHRRW